MTGPLFDAVRRDDLPDFLARLNALPDKDIATLRDPNGHTLLHWAALDGSLDIASEILSRAPDAAHAVSAAPTQLDQTPLHWAAVAGRHSVVRLLLAYRADLHARDAKGYAAIHHVAHYGHVATAHLLVKLGADPDTPDAAGRTPLAWAAYQGHLGLLMYFLRLCQVDVCARDSEGRTPLHRAAQADRAVEAAALLRHGADAACKDDHNFTPRALAIDRKATKTARTLDKLPSSPRFSLDRMAVVYFFYLVLAVSYYVYCSNIAVHYPAPTPLRLAFHVASVLAVITHSRTTYMDPGFIPRRSVSDLQDILNAIIGEGDQDKKFEYGPSGILDELTRNEFCFTCFCPREPVSHHCSTCDRCCRFFDHHCPWVNNCIGHRNHRLLLVMSVCVLLAETLFCTLGALLLQATMRHSGSGWTYAFSQYPLVLTLIAVHSLVAVFVIVLITTQVSLVIRGSTTHTYVRRIEQLRDAGEQLTTLQSLRTLGPAQLHHCVSFAQGERFAQPAAYEQI